MKEIDLAGNFAAEPKARKPERTALADERDASVRQSVVVRVTARFRQVHGDVGLQSPV
jgi:hypothetical protein